MGGATRNNSKQLCQASSIGIKLIQILPQSSLKSHGPVLNAPEIVISGCMHGYCGHLVMHCYQWLYAWLLWLSVVMHAYCGYQWLCMVISG